jgi:membrane protein
MLKDVSLMYSLKKYLDWPIAAYLMTLYKNVEEDYIGLVAGGVAFYFFLAAFPALTAMISLYGLFSDPAFVRDQLNLLDNFLPPESLKILVDQALSISSANKTALSFGLFMGIALTLYSTTKGVKALIQGLNIAFKQKEKRNLIKLNATSFTLTFVMLTYMLFSLSLIALMPAAFEFIHLPERISDTLLLLRWPLLLLSAIVGLQMIYYYAPSHTKPEWRWFSWGSLIATLLWLAGSNLFSLFVSNFGSYNETYGSLGAVAVLLLWFWLSAIIVLFGAEINAARTPVQSDRS